MRWMLGIERLQRWWKRSRRLKWCHYTGIIIVLKKEILVLFIRCLLKQSFWNSPKPWMPFLFCCQSHCWLSCQRKRHNQYNWTDGRPREGQFTVQLYAKLRPLDLICRTLWSLTNLSGMEALHEAYCTAGTAYSITMESIS